MNTPDKKNIFEQYFLDKRTDNGSVVFSGEKNGPLLTIRSADGSVITRSKLKSSVKEAYWWRLRWKESVNIQTT